MLCRRFCVPFFFFCVFFLFQVNSKTSFAAASPGYDLGVICVTAPAWNHPEEITGNADAEEFFEAVLFSGQTSVSEALDGLMGINLRTSGGLGHISGMSFGGLSGNKILIVKDGLPINDPFTGSPDISAFPLLQFERAQLWQGNRATIWGSNSIGGTIRLTSRFPDHGRFRLWSDGSGGNGQSTEARIYDTDNTRIGFRVGRFSTPGFSSAATAVGNGERDGFSHETGYLSIESNLKNRFQLQLSAETSKSLTDLDDFAGGVPVDSTSFRQQKVGNQFNIGLTRTQKNGELRITHVFNHSNTSGIDESNIFNEYGLETSRQMQTISQSLHNRETSGLIEFSRGETMARNHGVFSIRETEAAAVVALNHKLNHSLSFSSTMRYDRQQYNNNAKTGNFSLTHTDHDSSLAFSWGQAFRKPGLNERFYPAYGDPELKAEFSTSASLAFSHHFKKFARLTFKSTGYQIRDLIGTSSTVDPAYTWGIKAANLDRAELVSHQIMISEVKTGSITLNGDITFISKARQKNNGLHIPGIADRQAAIVIEKSFNKLSCRLHSRWWGSIWENAENTKKAGASSETSLFFKRDFKVCSAELGILNLADARQERTLGYTRPGRRFTMALEMLF